MAKKKRTETIIPEMPVGIKLVHTLSGHTASINRIAWSPDGKWIASPSFDNTIRVWDAKTGICHLELIGGNIKNVAFNSQSQIITGGDNYGNIYLWDVESGMLILQIKDDFDNLQGVVFHPHENILLSYLDTGIIKLWNSINGELIYAIDANNYKRVKNIFFDQDGKSFIVLYDRPENNICFYDTRSGNLIRTIDNLKNCICIAINPTNQLFATGDELPGVISLRNKSDGALLQRIEGHKSIVDFLQFSPEGQFLASKSNDDTIRIWRCDIWETIATLPAIKIKSHGWPGLSFHPNQPFLATVGSKFSTPKDKIKVDVTARDQNIYIWELDYPTLLSQKITRTVFYTSAKIVLVGESNAGKSWLALRIAKGRPPRSKEVKSTHGMKFWPIIPEKLSSSAIPPEGQNRDIVIWDMGGQDEYQLVHQLFLRDTTIAFVLFDPTRGNSTYEEVRAWNKRLEKQLQGHSVVKFLVGTKLDEPTDRINKKALKHLLDECNFAGFFETSALTGRGVEELCEATSKAIDWQGLSKTNRPELFQQIRDEIERLRKKGEVILHLSDLYPLLSDGPPEGELIGSVEAVAQQLASQGIIARANVATGEPVLVLQVQEIERYAGSLILGARNNPRGVPALELRAIAQSDFLLPGIPKKERLPRHQEILVLECTIVLMLEHGICFQHEGLLIFPTLFTTSYELKGVSLEYAVSLYYDFSGAIDNMYASLIAWLVLARDFGRVRLWPDRAEFEIKEGGLCGIRKVGRPGGFAHVDVYFESTTPIDQREAFINFVEEHLRKNGVEITEHITLKCPCGEQIKEDTIRLRIARGEKSIQCPVCEKCHSLAQGAMESRRQNAHLAQHSWALKTEIDERRQKSTERAVSVIEKAEEKPPHEPIRLLHLSDLHFDIGTSVKTKLESLIQDIQKGLGFDRLDYLVVSGDFTDRGSVEGFEKAYEFLSNLISEFDLSAERCIFVPGNHDVRDIDEVYEWRKNSSGLKEDEWLKQGDIILKRNAEKYPLRFKSFSDGFFHKFLQRPYPMEYAEQGMVIPFIEHGLQFLAFNSSWQIDQFFRKRSGIHQEAIANALYEARKQETEARKKGFDGPLLRIAVWHHAVAGPEQMQNTEFISILQNDGVKIGLHGDVHELRRDLICYWDEKSRLHIAGSGSFGSKAEGRPESTPRLYNLLEIQRDLRSVRVHTRQQPKSDGAWKGWHEWDDPDGGKGKVEFYDISWK